MPADPFADQAARLLAALDFSAAAAAEEEHREREQAAFLRCLLEVMDSFDRLLPEREAAGGEEAAAADAAAVPLRTVRLLARQLAGCLQRAGVTPFSDLGEMADPELHEIAGVQPGEEAARDTIVEVLSQGYRWNGRLLRHPRVIVAAGRKETRP